MFVPIWHVEVIGTASYMHYSLANEAWNEGLLKAPLSPSRMHAQPDTVHAPGVQDVTVCSKVRIM